LGCTVPHVGLSRLMNVGELHARSLTCQVGLRTRSSAVPVAFQEIFNAYPKTAGDCPNFAKSSEQGTDRRLVGTVPFAEAVFG
jgi:hypothetical protein